jgi:hypothetical protein
MAPPIPKQEPLKWLHEYKVHAVTCKKKCQVQEAVTAQELYKQSLAIKSNAKNDKQATKGVYLITARGTENCSSTISKVCLFQTVFLWMRKWEVRNWKHGIRMKYYAQQS